MIVQLGMLNGKVYQCSAKAICSFTIASIDTLDELEMGDMEDGFSIPLRPSEFIDVKFRSRRKKNSNGVGEKFLGDMEDGFSIPLRPSEFIDVKFRSRRKKNGEDEKFHGDSFVPGTNQSIFFRTWGCAHNSSDSEYMAGLLNRAGYSLVQEEDGADLWLLNSCTVKSPSEAQLMNSIERAQKKGIAVVVAGCVSQADPNSFKGVSVVGVRQLDRVVEVVDQTLAGGCVRLVSQRRAEPLSLDLPKIRKNDLIEVLAVNSGCLNHCTYCKTKLARGDLRSFSLNDLCQRVKCSIAEGVKEIWLTSEDLGAWGRDIGLALPDLLDALIGTGEGNDGLIPSGCMLRLGMTNPPYILDHLQDIARALNHPRVYSFLHIPVQSASDSVLAEMKREYTIDEFCKVVDYMQTHVPNVYIATDFICAFPTESESDFEQSLHLVEKYHFPSLFINQFYPRKGTPAARLKKIHSIEAKRRTGEMSRLFHSYTRYGDERIGQVVHVLVCERASDGQHLVGHTKSYEQVLINAPSSLLGQWSWVRVSAVSKFHMKAELIPEMSMAKLLSTSMAKVLSTSMVKVLSTSMVKVLSTSMAKVLSTSTWTPSFFLLITSILVLFILLFFSFFFF